MRPFASSHRNRGVNGAASYKRGGKTCADALITPPLMLQWSRRRESGRKGSELPERGNSLMIASLRPANRLLVMNAATAAVAVAYRWTRVMKVAAR